MIRLTAVSPPSSSRRSRIHEYNGIAAAGLSLCLILFFLSGAAAISPSMVNPLADLFFPSSARLVRRRLRKRNAAGGLAGGG